MNPTTGDAPIWVSEPKQIAQDEWHCLAHVWFDPRPASIRSLTRDGALYLAARYLEMLLRDHSDVQPPPPPSPDPPRFQQSPAKK